MKCPDCGAETRHTGTFRTLVGYGHLSDGHDHDDNCLTRRYVCENQHQWTESRRRRCPKTDCGWMGKASCPCHAGPKVAEWTDAEEYVTDEIMKVASQPRSTNALAAQREETQ